MNISLSGKNVLITGGAGGIGVEIVKSMHSLNANIIISGSNEQKLKSFADKFNPKVNYVVANLSKVKEVENLAENALTKFNNKLGNFVLSGIKPAPRGVPKLEVTFDLDANGILSVTAKDTNSGSSESIKITSDNRLSKSEIQKMVDEAEKFKEDDDKLEKKINLRNFIC